MSLSAEQLASERAILDAQNQAVERFDTEYLVAVFTDDAVINADRGARQGLKSIQGYFEETFAIFDSIKIKTLNVVFDPTQNVIFERAEHTLVLKGDPEKKEIKTIALSMAEKKLGSAEKKMTGYTRFSGAAEVHERLAYVMSLRAK